MKLSFSNLLSAATITGSADAAGFGAANLKTPQSPFSAPAKTSAGGAQNYVIDFGVATTLDMVGLVHVNFTSATLQGNATDSWGAPSFTQALTITRNPWTWRYQLHQALSGFNLRFARLVIPSQTPVDGATGYRIGGVWAGRLTDTPTFFRWNVEKRVRLPRRDTEAEHGGWGYQLVLGDPTVEITAQIADDVKKATPGLNDGVAAWQEILRQAWAAGTFWFYDDKGDSSSAWPVQRRNDIAWTLDAGLGTTPLELKEVVAP